MDRVKLQSELSSLESRHGRVIKSYCNSVGCKECTTKQYYSDSGYTCASSRIQDKIMAIESLLFELNCYGCDSIC